MKQGNWLVLARTRFMLNELEEQLYAQGLYYENKYKTNREQDLYKACLLYTSPSPRDRQKSRMPSSA